MLIVQYYLYTPKTQHGEHRGNYTVYRFSTIVWKQMTRGYICFISVRYNSDEPNLIKYYNLTFEMVGLSVLYLQNWWHNDPFSPGSHVLMIIVVLCSYHDSHNSKSTGIMWTCISIGEWNAKTCVIPHASPTHNSIKLTILTACEYISKITDCLSLYGRAEWVIGCRCKCLLLTSMLGHAKEYRNYLSVKMSVCWDWQYQHFEKTGIIPSPYHILILMYSMKKFVRAVSEESYYMEGWMDWQTHKTKTFSKILLLLWRQTRTWK